MWNHVETCFQAVLICRSDCVYKQENECIHLKQCCKVLPTLHLNRKCRCMVTQLGLLFLKIPIWTLVELGEQTGTVDTLLYPDSVSRQINGCFNNKLTIGPYTHSMESQMRHKKATGKYCRHIKIACGFLKTIANCNVTNWSRSCSVWV